MYVFTYTNRIDLFIDLFPATYVQQLREDPEDQHPGFHQQEIVISFCFVCKN